MLTVVDILEGPRTSRDNKRWVPALPVVGPLPWRVRDAWEVLRGRAHAVRQMTEAEWAPPSRDREEPR